MSNLPFININCYKCKEEGKLFIGERVVPSNYDVMWIGDFLCEKCGAIMHVDGVNLSDEEARKISYENWGVWGLYLDIENQNELLKALLVLKKKALINQKDIKTVKDKNPGIVLEGTSAEMQRLKIFLEEDGIKSELVRIK